MHRKNRQISLIMSQRCSKRNAQPRVPPTIPQGHLPGITKKSTINYRKGNAKNRTKNTTKYDEKNIEGIEECQSSHNDSNASFTKPASSTKTRKDIAKAITTLDISLAYHEVDYDQVSADFGDELGESMFNEAVTPWESFIKAMIMSVGDLEPDSPNRKLDCLACWVIWEIKTRLIKPIVLPTVPNLCKYFNSNLNSIRRHNSRQEVVNTSLAIHLFVLLEDREDVRFQFITQKKVFNFLMCTIKQFDEKLNYNAAKYSLLTLIVGYLNQPNSIAEISGDNQFMKSLNSIATRRPANHWELIEQKGRPTVEERLMLEYRQMNVVYNLVVLARIVQNLIRGDTPSISMFYTPSVMMPVTYGSWLYGTYHGWTTYQLPKTIKPKKSYYFEIVLLTIGSIKIGISLEFNPKSLSEDTDGFNVAARADLNSIMYDASERSTWINGFEQLDDPAEEAGNEAKPNFIQQVTECSIVGCLINPTDDSITFYVDGVSMCKHHLDKISDHRLTICLAAFQQVIVRFQRRHWLHPPTIENVCEFPSPGQLVSVDAYLEDIERVTMVRPGMNNLEESKPCEDDKDDAVENDSDGNDVVVNDAVVNDDDTDIEEGDTIDEDQPCCSWQISVYSQKVDDIHSNPGPSQRSSSASSHQSLTQFPELSKDLCNNKPANSIQGSSSVDHTMMSHEADETAENRTESNSIEISYAPSNVDRSSETISSENEPPTLCDNISMISNEAPADQLIEPVGQSYKLTNSDLSQNLEKKSILEVIQNNPIAQEQPANNLRDKSALQRGNSKALKRSLSKKDLLPCVQSRSVCDSLQTSQVNQSVLNASGRPKRRCTVTSAAVGISSNDQLDVSPKRHKDFDDVCLESAPDNAKISEVIQPQSDQPEKNDQTSTRSESPPRPSDSVSELNSLEHNQQPSHEATSMNDHVDKNYHLDSWIRGNSLEIPHFPAESLHSESTGNFIAPKDYTESGYLPKLFEATLPSYPTGEFHYTNQQPQSSPHNSPFDSCLSKPNTSRDISASVSYSPEYGPTYNPSEMDPGNSPNSFASSGYHSENYSNPNSHNSNQFSPNSDSCDNYQINLTYSENQCPVDSKLHSITEEAKQQQVPKVNVVSSDEVSGEEVKQCSKETTLPADSLTFDPLPETTISFEPPKLVDLCKIVIACSCTNSTEVPIYMIEQQQVPKVNVVLSVEASVEEAKESLATLSANCLTFDPLPQTDITIEPPKLVDLCKIVIACSCTNSTEVPIQVTEQQQAPKVDVVSCVEVSGEEAKESSATLLSNSLSFDLIYHLPEATNSCEPPKLLDLCKIAIACSYTCPTEVSSQETNQPAISTSTSDVKGSPSVHSEQVNYPDLESNHSSDTEIIANEDEVDDYELRDQLLNSVPESLPYEVIGSDSLEFPCVPLSEDLGSDFDLSLFEDVEFDFDQLLPSSSQSMIENDDISERELSLPIVTLNHKLELCYKPFDYLSNQINGPLDIATKTPTMDKSTEMTAYESETTSSKSPEFDDAASDKTIDNTLEIDRQYFACNDLANSVPFNSPIPYFPHLIANSPKCEINKFRNILLDDAIGASSVSPNSPNAIIRTEKHNKPNNSMHPNSNDHFNMNQNIISRKSDCYNQPKTSPSLGRGKLIQLELRDNQESANLTALSDLEQVLGLDGGLVPELNANVATNLEQLNYSNCHQSVDSVDALQSAERRRHIKELAYSLATTQPTANGSAILNQYATQVNPQLNSQFNGRISASRPPRQHQHIATFDDDTESDPKVSHNETIKNIIDQLGDDHLRVNSFVPSSLMNLPMFPNGQLPHLALPRVNHIGGPGSVTQLNSSQHYYHQRASVNPICVPSVDNNNSCEVIMNQSMYNIEQALKVQLPATSPQTSSEKCSKEANSTSQPDIGKRSEPKPDIFSEPGCSEIRGEPYPTKKFFQANRKRSYRDDKLQPNPRSRKKSKNPPDRVAGPLYSLHSPKQAPIPSTVSSANIVMPYENGSINLDKPDQASRQCQIEVENGNQCPIEGHRVQCQVYISAATCHLPSEDDERPFSKTVERREQIKYRKISKIEREDQILSQMKINHSKQLEELIKRFMSDPWPGDEQQTKDNNSKLPPGVGGLPAEFSQSQASHGSLSAKAQPSETTQCSSSPSNENQSNSSYAQEINGTSVDLDRLGQIDSEKDDKKLLRAMLLNSDNETKAKPNVSMAQPEQFKVLEKPPNAISSNQLAAEENPHLYSLINSKSSYPETKVHEPNYSLRYEVPINRNGGTVIESGSLSNYSNHNSSRFGLYSTGRPAVPGQTTLNRSIPPTYRSRNNNSKVGPKNRPKPMKPPASFTHPNQTHSVQPLSELMHLLSGPTLVNGSNFYVGQPGPVGLANQFPNFNYINSPYQFNPFPNVMLQPIELNQFSIQQVSSAKHNFTSSQGSIGSGQKRADKNNNFANKTEANKKACTSGIVLHKPIQNGHLKSGQSQDSSQAVASPPSFGLPNGPSSSSKPNQFQNELNYQNPILYSAAEQSYYTSCLMQPDTKQKSIIF